MLNYNYQKLITFLFILNYETPIFCHSRESGNPDFTRLTPGFPLSRE